MSSTGYIGRCSLFFLHAFLPWLEELLGGKLPGLAVVGPGPGSTVPLLPAVGAGAGFAGRFLLFNRSGPGAGGLLLVAGPGSGLLLNWGPGSGS